MIADQSERLGLRMPPFSVLANEKLHSILGNKVHVANPLDYHTYIWGDYDAMRNCFLAVLNEDYDCTIFVIDYPRDGINKDGWALAVSALVDARE
jgi:acetyl-CoA synthetase